MSSAEPLSAIRPHGTDLRTAGIQNLRELNPLIPVALGVLALFQELPYVFSCSVERGTPGFLHAGSAVVDDLGDPDPLVFSKWTLPTFIEELLKISGVPSSALRAASCRDLPPTFAF